MVSVCWFRLTVHTSPAENKKPGMSTRQGHKNIKSILKFKCGIKKKESSITTKVSFSSSDDEVHTTYHTVMKSIIEGILTSMMLSDVEIV